MRRLLPVMLCMLLWSMPAQAWNDYGHMVIALLAYEDLHKDEDVWNKIVSILKNHPRLADLKAGLPEGASDKEAWKYVFLKAATWPDMVRAKPTDSPEKQVLAQKYHRGNWHYINYPLNRDDVNGPEPQPDEVNIVWALGHNEKILRDPKASLEDQAIALCWMLHLIGDAHQPLHSAALFSKDFPKGDRGGTLFTLVDNKPANSLHSLWDGLLGSNTDIKAVEMIMYDSSAHSRFDAPKARVVSLEELINSAKKAAEKEQKMTYEDWLKESFALAKESVYPAELVFQQPLPEQYFEKTKEIAYRQARLAAQRMSLKLFQIFKAK